MRRWLMAICGILLLALPLRAATGTAAWSAPTNPSSGLRAYRVQLTSDGGGDVNGNAHAVLSGRIIQVRVVPGTGGNQPDDEYNVQILDRSGIDLLVGSGAKLSQSAGALITGLDIWQDTANPSLDVTLSSAGATKQVTVTILVQLSPGDK